MAELVVKCNIPVILVIGIKLGCLNHAILTHQTILRAECKIKGWVANCIDPAMQAIDDNIGSLQKMLSSPCLGVVPYLAKPEAVLAASSFFEYQA
jgi:dethiobiotin synthetase